MRQFSMVGAAAPFESRVAAAGAGATWWAEGWRMFRSRIGAWVAIIAVYFAISLLLNEAPRLGAIAEWLLSPVLVGGIMLGCDAERLGRPLRLSHLFDGFRAPHFVPLLRVALWNLAFGCLGVAVAVIVIVLGIGVSGITDLASYADDPLRMWETLGVTYLLLIVLGLVFVRGARDGQLVRTGADRAERRDGAGRNDDEPARIAAQLAAVPGLRLGRRSPS